MKKYRKIVVTGGSGLLGRYLKKILPDATYLSSTDYNLLEQTEIRKMFKKLKNGKLNPNFKKKVQKSENCLNRINQV